MSGGCSSLAMLGAGQRGCVLPSKANQIVSPRLMAMGLLPGIEVKVVQVAPLGDPLEIEFRGTRLSLRKADAATVEVERLDD